MDIKEEVEGEIMTVEQMRERDILHIAGVEARQKMAFWRLYLDPTSPTLMNAKQSAISAGFPEDQANAVTQYKWFKRGTMKDRLLEVAEKTLEDMLTLPRTTVKIVKGEEVLVDDPAMVKIIQDTAKYIASTLGKKDYSQRNELTGKKGGAIETVAVKIDDKEFDNILERYAAKRSAKRTTEEGCIEESISK